MLTPQALIVFYSICGAIVALMLVRLWRKNRTKVDVAQVPQTPSLQNPVKETAPTAVATTRMTDAPTRDVVPPVPAPTNTYVPPVAPTYATTAALDQVAAPRLSTSAYQTDANLGSSSWGEKRLLEATGMLPRNNNPMPRVLPADVPGVGDNDRTFGSWLNPAFASLVPESDERREETRKDLMSAGFYNPHALENLAATRYVLMMMGVMVFGALLLVVPPQLEPWMVSGCVLAPLLGWALPALYVRGKAKERKHQIERAMPDLLDMLNMCVGQGLTVPDALQRVGRDFRAVYPALSQELGIVNEQSKISTLQTALENFSQRIDLLEVHSLTSLLIQTERMGTSISQALTTYSDTMRESQRQQADEKGNRATFRLLFPTVLCLMPAVYLFLLGPAINELQRFFYNGGLDSVNSGSQVVQRLNATRAGGSNTAARLNPNR